MNVPFRIKLNDKYDEALEKKFLIEAEKLKMRELNGHRSVGGIRASIFNAISLEEVEILVDHMNLFAIEHRHEIHKVHHHREIHHHVKHEEQIHIKA
jgi:phosphoserine aminotransferase